LIQSDAALTGNGLDCLLALLDGDRERAGQRYVLLRQKLVSFFCWRRALSPEECADETLNIAARRIAEGEPVRDVGCYCIGIARLVVLQHRRENERFTPASSEVVAPQFDIRGADDLRLQCLERCLQELPDDSRQLILAYYESQGGSAIESRRLLARRLGVPLNALRIRAYRIRARLEESVRRMLVDTAGPDETV
jgi:DNA-directed RNA polymerase specialized sigma24 family protein